MGHSKNVSIGMVNKWRRSEFIPLRFFDINIFFNHPVFVFCEVGFKSFFLFDKKSISSWIVYK